LVQGPEGCPERGRAAFMARAGLAFEADFGRDVRDVIAFFAMIPV
jgi:hypothetical protein